MRKNSFFVLILSLFLFIKTVFGAELDISLDKNVINEGDTVFLTITYTGDDHSAPDLTYLQNDFNIVSNSSSQNIQYINGQVSQYKTWRIGLVPLFKGKKVIKPISLAGLTSNYEELEVKEITDVAFVPDSKENSNSPFFQITQDVDTSEPFVQQQMLLNVTIYDSIGLRNGSLSIDESSKNNWIVSALSDKPRIKQKVINGKNMNLITFSYAIFPQKSGVLDLPTFSFDGYYIKNVQRGFPGFDDDFSFFGIDFNQAFGQRVPVKIKTKKQSLNVKPAPALPQGATWLPLTDLKINASWLDTSKFYEGEAINRKISIEAMGASKDMLPKINFPDIEYMRQYPEDPQYEEKIIQKKVVSFADINNVYIPQKVGVYTIPAIKLVWFNLNTQKFETATIPSETIDIKENPNNKPFVFDSVSSSSKPLQDNIKKNSSVQPDVVEQKVLNNAQAKLKDRTLWLFVGGGLFGLLLIILLYFALHKKKQTFSAEVIKSIKNHQYIEAKKALLSWAQHKFPDTPINNFNDIINIVNNDDFKEFLLKMNKIIYGNSDELFDGSSFLNIFKKIDKSKNNIYKDEIILPNLYK